MDDDRVSEPRLSRRPAVALARVRAPITDRVDDLTDLRGPLWRALVVFRILALAYSVIDTAIGHRPVTSPLGAAVLFVVMTAWTALTSVGYLSGWARTIRFGYLDVAVTMLCMVGTFLGQSPELVKSGAPILTSIWVPGAVLALALIGPIRHGVIASLLLSCTILSVSRRFTQIEISDIILLILTAFLFGYAAQATRTATERLRQAIIAQAATAERERLSRSIHDGVLQVLGHIGRRASAMGGQAVELGKLAEDQGIALRSLITSQGRDVTGQTDLGSELSALAGSSTTVAVPAEPIVLSAEVVDEILAVVNEALTNTARHGGSGARSWILLEDDPDELVLTVRDDGVGSDPSRVQRAIGEGHLGVEQSMKGRVRDLGGTITCQTAAGEGMEWEIRLPATDRGTTA